MSESQIIPKDLSLDYEPEEMVVLNFGGVVMPHDEYATRVTVFPGSNAIPTWGTSGNFFIDLEVYQDKKLLGTVRTEKTDETGLLDVDLDQLTQYLDGSQSAVLSAAYHLSGGIPVELYCAHVHRETGSYIAYPALPFMGDIIYPEVHSQQLENTLFWPGLPISEQMEDHIVVVNPYKLPFHYQLSLFLPNGERVQTDPLKLQRFSCQWHNIEELFSDHMETLLTDGASCSLCVGAQYKVVAFNAIKNRKTGLVTTLDHLHRYTLV